MSFFDTIGDAFKSLGGTISSGLDTGRADMTQGLGFLIHGMMFAQDVVINGVKTKVFLPILNAADQGSRYIVNGVTYVWTGSAWVTEQTYDQLVHALHDAAAGAGVDVGAIVKAILAAQGQV